MSKFIIAFFLCPGVLHGMCKVMESNTIELISPHPVAEHHSNEVYMHLLAKEFNINPYTLHFSSVSSGYGGRGYENLNLIFVRDYFPLQAKVIRDGQLKSVFIEYPSLINGGHSHQIYGRALPVKPPAENHHRLSYETSHEKIEFWAETKTLPLIMEGGNILKTAQNIFIGHKIIEVNSKTEKDLAIELSGGSENLTQKAKEVIQAAKELGWKTRSREEILKEIADAFEIQTNQIQVLDSMPLEKTQHIDLYLGIIGHTKVAIPKIPVSVIESTPEGRAESTSLNLWLDQRATQLESLGYEVLRIPMLAPTQYSKSESLSTASIPSPVNWLIQGKKITVPKFSELEKKYPERVIKEINSEFESLLQNEGFKIEYMEADKLLSSNGLIHCITAQYDLSEFYQHKTENKAY